MRRVLVFGAAAITALLASCATRSVPAEEARLTDQQVSDLVAHSDRWAGRGVTIAVFPYDNGYRGSYVACLQRCDAAGADRSVVLLYTTEGRFTGFAGDRMVMIRAKVRALCPPGMVLCLDAPIRTVALDEVEP